MRLLRSGLLAATLALGASGAQAAILTYQITGTVTTAVGTLAALNGTNYVATFAYDNTVLDTNGLPNVGGYVQLQNFNWNVNSGALVGSAPLTRLSLTNGLFADSVLVDTPVSTPWDALITLIGPNSVFANADVILPFLPALSAFTTTKTFTISQLNGVSQLGSLTASITEMTLVPVPAMGGLFALAAAGLITLRRRMA